MSVIDRITEHDVVVGETFTGHFATCACGWSTGTPEEKGVSEDEIRRRVREHRQPALERPVPTH